MTQASAHVHATGGLSFIDLGLPMCSRRAPPTETGTLLPTRGVIRQSQASAGPSRPDDWRMLPSRGCHCFPSKPIFEHTTHADGGDGKIAYCFMQISRHQYQVKIPYSKGLFYVITSSRHVHVLS